MGRATVGDGRSAAARALPFALTYPDDLPVSHRRDDIAAAIRDHPVVIVSGETGSGKTTQLPKICLELGRGVDGMIGHTQPRRIAARSVAERVAEELGVAVGGAVGYQVRFTDEVSATTLVKVMTDGILLAEIQRDPLLRRYDTLIVDEAHERSLTIDFILGYVAGLLPRRPDLKVVITSATIDSARFADHFAVAGRPAPVVEVTGRTYPVEIRYRPLVPGVDADPPRGDEAPARGAVPRGTGSPGTASPGDRSLVPAEPLDQTTAICRAVDELVAEGPGDILVFLSGEREIRDTADGLREHLGPRFAAVGAHPSSVPPGAIEVLPLYARLSSAEQHRVFESHRLRRVVLATNVAETSLTVPGVRYVVDPGTARISRYSNRTKVQRLPIEPISRASADQRAGRCGRVADGVCIRLYSRDDLQRRPEFTEPEILRTSLASVILQMAALGLGEVADFPFVDPPDGRAVRDGLQLLVELGALTAGTGGRRLTDIGRALARLPVDPRLGRMLVEAGRLGCVREVLVVVAALSVQDVRERPAEAQQAADERHRRFVDPTSDFLTVLALWEYLREQQRDLSSSAFRRLCRAEFLSWLRVREWQDVHEQLRRLAKPLGLRVGPPAAGDLDADAIHRAVLSGLLSHIGAYDERRREYQGARGSRFVIFPGSALARRPPAWVMAAELVETSRLFARTVARIQPDWVEPLAGHLVRRTYSEPRWSGRRAAAVVSEKVLLYGIPLVVDRPVPLGRIDPPAARDLFIRHALVDGDWRAHHRFLAQNRELVARAEELEHRARRRGIVADADALHDFYEARLPESIVSGAHFDAWWKTERRRTPDLLTLTPDVLAPEAAQVEEADFPTTWRQGDLALPLTYTFAPGAEGDGVTVHVPLAVLPRLRPDGFDWMVPGLLDDLVVATIRALPKALRVQLVPAPDVAREIADRLPAWSLGASGTVGAPSFHEAFADAARDTRGVDITDDAWADDRLPPYLRMTFRAVGERGEVLDEDKDLLALRRRLSVRSSDAVRAAVRSAVRQAGEASRQPPHRTPAAPPVAEPQVGAAQVAAPQVGAAQVGAAQVVAPQVAAPQVGAAPVAEPRPTHRSLGGPPLLERPDLRGFPVDLPGGRIPDVVETVGPDGHRVLAYPALAAETVGPDGHRVPAHPLLAVDPTAPQDGSTGRPATEIPGPPRVALRLMSTPGDAAATHPDGIRRLLVLAAGLPAGRVTSRWTGPVALALATGPDPGTAALVDDVQLAAVCGLTRADDLGRVRSAPAFAALEARVRASLEDEVHRVVGHVVAALTASRELVVALEGKSSPALRDVVADVRAQHALLIRPGFVAATPPERLPHLARYLRAAVHRIEKAVEHPDRDAAVAVRIAALERSLADVRTAVLAGPVDAERVAKVDDVRWLLEELRVSLFAQRLGTAVPVSEKRITKALAAI